ncbi:LysR substrate-binding domain-containing protein [Yinghuangia seranimata]|uniref:LysR substrate-binding domain-containing protein n=1 Tax=Yinghuangia seranimata TaxID=408067 RepID=UPI00248BD73F|nr:LysR substrate-binding domain-containing protein [Yinghuangia seranimata]MDI2128849.1 LysR substrate-binding domain-containing protein [Yinghuangia seranimata]
MSTRTPTIAQLKAFAAVADHLHFRDAAAVVGTSQPALSSAVAALEEALGTQLVERTTRRVLLTPAGERVARHARRVLDALDDLVDEAESARRPFTGPLHLGVIPTVAPYVLPTLLRLVRDEYRELDLYVHEEQTHSLLDGLAAGRLDLLLLALPAGVPGVDEIPVYDEDFTLVVPEGHPLAGCQGVPRAQLRDMDILLLDEGHCLRDQALDVCREVGAAEAGATRAASLPTLVQLVAGGLGATLLPETAIGVETRPGSRLAVARFTDPAPYRRIGLVLRASTGRAAEFSQLAESLRQSIADLPVRVVRG